MTRHATRNERAFGQLHARTHQLMLRHFQRRLRSTPDAEDLTQETFCKLHRAVGMAAAGAGLGKIDFPFPGVMFKFLVMVGPVPITIGVGAKLIGSIVVPAKASATAKSRFRYQSSSGFEYQGSDVEVKGNIGSLEFTPDPFDSAAMISIPVDAQWGVAFPRISVSVFDSLFVPYLHTGVVVGSSLKWGPVCKWGYVKYVSEVGYDFKVFGVTLKKDKVKVAEKGKRAPEAGCR